MPYFLGLFDANNLIYLIYTLSKISINERNVYFDWKIFIFIPHMYQNIIFNMERTVNSTVMYNIITDYYAWSFVSILRYSDFVTLQELSMTRWLFLVCESNLCSFTACWNFLSLLDIWSILGKVKPLNWYAKGLRERWCVAIINLGHFQILKQTTEVWKPFPTVEDQNCDGISPDHS